MMGYLHPCPSRIRFSSHHQKMSGYPSLETVFPVGIAVKSPRILDGFYNGDSTLYTSPHFKRMDTAGAGVVKFRDCALADVISRNDLSPKAVDGK